MRAAVRRIAGCVAASAFLALGVTAPAGATTAERLSLTGGCPSAPSLGQDVAPGRGRTVALTFDDGPGGSTREILAILAREHVTATFFNLGDNEVGSPRIVRTEAREGYVLGDHTWDHADLTTLDASGQASEIDRERAEQTKITGHESCLLRPPYGSMDATTVSLARTRHMTIWLWSVDTEDWKADGSAAPYWVNRITSRADAGGAQQHPVILMHNQPAGNPATVAALPRVIRFYKQRGYTFVDLLGNTGPPTVTSLHAPVGSTSGGGPVVIRGANFRDVTAVRFGRQLATRFTVKSPGKIVATAPARRPGTVAVSVTTADHGRSLPTSAADYRYVNAPTISAIRPARGPTTGGEHVRILGTNFYDVRAVRIGRMVVRPVRTASPTKIEIITPPHQRPGTLDVIVRTAFGVTSPHPADRYTYRTPT
jgi:peptidoglycan/xylan/chitin deacetylase (PgdA/CDA1 family)